MKRIFKALAFAFGVFALAFFAVVVGLFVIAGGVWLVTTFSVTKAIVIAAVAFVLYGGWLLTADEEES